MTDTLDQLDPNYVISFDYSEDNLTLLVSKLSQLGIKALSRPGNDENTVYLYFRIDEHPSEYTSFSGGVDNITSNNNGNNVLSETRTLALFEAVRNNEFVHSIIPLYELDKQKRLNQFFHDQVYKKPLALPTDSELKQLSDLTGNPKLSLYFAYMATYTKKLKYLAIAGLMVRILFGNSFHEFSTLYSIGLNIWTLYFTTSWIYDLQPKYKWKLTHGQSDESDNINSYDNPNTVRIKKLCFIPIVIAFVIALISFQLLCFVIEIFITQLYDGPLIRILTLLPTILISIFTPTLQTIFNKLFVEKFVAWENGPNPKKSKVEKNFMLTFFINYSPLLITLFLYLPFGYKFTPEWKQRTTRYVQSMNVPVTKSNFKVHTNRYKIQFFYFTVTNQLILFFTQNILPLIMEKVLPKFKDENKPTSTKFKIKRQFKKSYPKDFKLWERTNSYITGPWDEFNEDINYEKLNIQLGFVIMFSIIWPLSPMICYIFNHIIIKADLWRAIEKCKPSVPSFSRIQQQNTVPLKVKDNNTVNANPTFVWNIILMVMAIIGSTLSSLLTYMYRNCHLPDVGYTSPLEKEDIWYRFFPLSHSWPSILLFAVIMEHIVLLSYFFLSRIVCGLNECNNTGFVPLDKNLVVKRKTDLSKVISATKEFMEPLTLLKSKENDNVQQSTERTIGRRRSTMSSIESKPENLQFLKENISHEEVTTNTSNQDRNYTKEKQPTKINQYENENVNRDEYPKVISVPANERPPDIIDQRKRRPSGTIQRRKSSVSYKVAGATIPDVIPTSRSKPTSKSKKIIETTSVSKLQPTTARPLSSTDRSLSIKAASAALKDDTLTDIEPLPPGKHTKQVQQEQEQQQQKHQQDEEEQYRQEQQQRQEHEYEQEQQQQQHQQHQQRNPEQQQFNAQELEERELARQQMELAAQAHEGEHFNEDMGDAPKLQLNDETVDTTPSVERRHSIGSQVLKTVKSPIKHIQKTATTHSSRRKSSKSETTPGGKKKKMPGFLTKIQNKL
ncbi:uncharacterized protein NDAI_0A05360 [Naumovozyma dairenensis CBS 421]|uniref:Anoctamin transmembrane domain-containing protein n=1 Tax=Naumovozyma dairenensis (strain ATCC 10597 / BCRC 20456 / CBS 421 / NBRC 0211 / NRRL Y-12639) TaxID=1071378 RepID=G0W4F3_NAUDC|nr:hypothetical protein NDAI_0A05360 [Naumovozyma dairenensis CBS 421]CCD22691.1 hypothetical protein NDAI_0A05360 [Naumovozyma dairenensis CBS 421]